MGCRTLCHKFKNVYFLMGTRFMASKCPSIRPLVYLKKKNEAREQLGVGTAFIVAIAIVT